MPELTIYDSHGKPYGDSGRGRSNDRIEEFFFGGVKLYLDAGSRTELVVFFRARESNVGRAEQFYAVYTTRNTRNLFENFRSELRQRVESEYGMSIETSSDDVRVYEALGGRNDSVPGSEFDHSVVSNLLQSGKRLRFGVSSASGALALCSKYLQGSANRVAIADNTSIDALESCNLAIEVGNHRGLEPLGETSRLMDEQRRNMEGQLINEKVTTIKQEIDDLRTKTSKSDEQIRNRLKRQISIFETPPPPSSTGGRFDALPNLSRPQKLAGGVVVLVVLIALVSVATAGLLGEPDALADALGFNDDDVDEPEAALESVTVAGEEIANFDEQQNATLSEGELHVAGKTNGDGDAVRITFIPDDGGGNATIEPDIGDDDSFDATLTDLEPGSGKLRVEVATDDGEFEPETSKSVRLNVESEADAPTLEDVMVGDNSFDDLEATENAAVTLSDGELVISGTTNREAVVVSFDPEDGDDRTNDSSDVENGSFDVVLSGLEPGSGELLIEAGSATDGEFESEINESVTLELEPEPALETESVGDASFADLEAGENAGVTLSDGKLTIEGSTNQESVEVSFEPEDGSETSSNTTDVSDGSFTVTLSDLEPGSGELLVEAGSNDGEFESEVNESATIVLEPEPTLEDVMVGDKRFDELDENENVTVSDGELTIEGSTNQESVEVSFEPEDGSETVSNTTNVGDGSFTVTLSGLESGSGELLVKTGFDDETDEAEVERRAAIRLESNGSN
ncbi:hypothetical protein Htur_1070 [Haloterrigena turkmenica DSM 5511]|uniref:Uncharacterized protein n=1 Tax=Haloterrigena turkmenica (strain ATCC 51198 / DSM 5511 / JCM 9101 / NCIMB 13204 / VKM B-1734 / 4k) TaxID=543526 RepID=D2RZ38_HALTV|nr:hypothetical protein [Haloterrigena turkmenica]ADB59962.1 hypothetical protein Htur_1070 [Haloterrigena turkmenica DSM 5511]